jgi:hypothetical protein
LTTALGQRFAALRQWFVSLGERFVPGELFATLR